MQLLFQLRSVVLLSNDLENFVSKETVILRQWESETKIGFIKRADKGRRTTVKDVESSRFER